VDTVGSDVHWVLRWLVNRPVSDQSESSISYAEITSMFADYIWGVVDG
jgi:hypothetical protein